MAALLVATALPSGPGRHDLVTTPGPGRRIVVDRLLIQGTGTADQLVEVYGGDERLAVLVATAAPVTIDGAVQCDDGADRHLKLAPDAALAVVLSGDDGLAVTTFYHTEQA